MGFILRLGSQVESGIANTQSLPAARALLLGGHVEKDLPNLVGGQAEEILHGGRLGFVQGLHEPQPGFMDHAVHFMASLQAGKRPMEHVGRQPAQPVAGPLQKQLAGGRISLLKAVQGQLERQFGFSGHKRTFPRAVATKEC